MWTLVREDEWLDKVRDHVHGVRLEAVQADGLTKLLAESLDDATRQRRWKDAYFYAQALHERAAHGTPLRREVACLLIRLAGK